MNKQIYKYLLLLIAGGTLLGSCSKSFVTKNPYNELPIADALNTPTVLASDLEACYAELRGTDQYGRDWPVIGDLMADNTFLESDNSGRYIVQYGYIVPITDGPTDGIWSESYNGILNCNEIINSGVSGASATIAQAYAIRALIYFKLVTFFANPYTVDSSALGVPLITQFNATYEPERASVGTVYNQIVSDLKTALSLGPPSYSNSVTLSYYAIEGLLARVYMYMGDYTDALAAAQDVINRGPFQLVSASQFTSFWADAGIHSDAVEVMFEIDFDAINNNGYDDLGGIYINGYQDLYCSSQLANLYTNTDVRKQLLVWGTTKSGDSAWLVNKYPNATATDPDNPKVIRLAEVYLIAAECENQLGNDALAKPYVNAVAEARDPANTTGYTDIGAALLADIVQERRKELAFEGDRLYDMNRLGLAINRASNPGSTPLGNGLSIPYPDDQRIGPIPQAEILRNPNIASEQNPGY
jgi:starch-binding outer membrane protein, SusD/RagB family